MIKPEAELDCDRAVGLSLGAAFLLILKLLV